MADLPRETKEMENMEDDSVSVNDSVLDDITDILGTHSQSGLSSELGDVTLEVGLD